MRGLIVGFVMALASGCVVPIDEVGTKTEPVLGAACSSDGQCAAAEYCAVPVCIRAPCPADGTCQPRFNFQVSPRLSIPDADPRGVSQTFSVVNPGATVAGLSVNVQITHTYRGDLRVALRSPAGTEVVLHDRAGGSADNLLIDQARTELNGELASGTWTLLVSDHASADLGTVDSVRLVFTYGAATDPGTEVWTSVPLSGIESAHNYANSFDRSWNLRPFAGSGTRARVRFERIDVETDWDFVEILDANSGELLQRITGSHTSFVSDTFDTVDLTVRLITDDSIVRWGFKATALELYGAGCLVDSDCGAGYFCPISRVCVRAPCFQECVPRSAGSEPGDPCTSNADCREEMYCGGGICRIDGTCGNAAQCTADGNAWVHVFCVGSATCSASGNCNWVCGLVGGGPGAACTVPGDCASGLYCGSDRTCHPAGSCAADSDCNRSDNPFAHSTCSTGAGVGVCDAGVCDWECPPAPICRDGETTFDGCNTCSCSGGLWRCTTRFCPAPVGEGGRCGGSSRIECTSELYCDHGSDTAGQCDEAFREGTCRRTPTTSCALTYSPVCGCNGQTFDNECSRLSLAAYDRSGRCELATSIPDNAPDGVSVTIDAGARSRARYADVDLEIDHTWRGDLVVELTSPDGRRYLLTNRAGSSADHFDFSGTADLGSADARGRWTLHVSDHAAADVGAIRFFNISLR